MTVGNVTRDPRQTISVFDPYAGVVVNHKIGTRVGRNWSGTDRAPQEPYRPVPEERSPGLGALSRPPARARTEEHPYSCVGFAETTAFCTARNSAGLLRTSNGWANPIFGADYIPWTTNDNNALLSSLRSKVAGSDFNAGVFLGEGRESLRMIANSASKIYNSLRLVKRGRFGDASRILTGTGNNRRIARYDDPNWIDSVSFRKRDNAARMYDRDVSSQWLELQYGWLPLLKDAQGAAEFLAHQFSAPLQTRIKVRRVLKSKGIGPSSAPPDFEYGSYRRMTSRQIIVRLKETSVVQLSGLLDAPSVAWELLPWSFVIDWFVPIGNYLANRGLAHSLTGEYIVTLFERATFSGIRAKPSNGSNFASQWKMTGGENACKYEYYRVTRLIYPSLVGVLSSPSIKPLGDVPSWKRAANSLALLDQLRPRDLTKVAVKLGF